MFPGTATQNRAARKMLHKQLKMTVRTGPDGENKIFAFGNSRLIPVKRRTFH